MNHGGGRAIEPTQNQALRDVKLSPEMAERVRRMAASRNVPPDRIVEDALTILWIRFGANQGLSKGEW